MLDMKKELTPEVKALFAEYPALEPILTDPALSAVERKMRATAILRRIQQEKGGILDRLRTADEEIAFLKQKQCALEGLQETWTKLSFAKLERNEHSRIHSLIAEFKADRVVWLKDHIQSKDSALLWPELHTFVVQHDWASAFSGATDYDGGEVTLPYPKCAFEFRISGRNVIVIALQANDYAVPLACLPFVESEGLWVCLEEEGRKIVPLQLAWDEIRAICIALDAEVATHSVVRAPEKLNAKRVKEGKEPLLAYSVVSLARRVRVTNPSYGGGSHSGKKRLHFRRGHWRDYAEFKTWVRWCLVGNPELGFIDHEYRL